MEKGYFQNRFHSVGEFNIETIRNEGQHLKNARDILFFKMSVPTPALLMLIAQASIYIGIYKSQKWSFLEMVTGPEVQPVLSVCMLKD